MLYRDSCQRCSTLGPGTVISRACLTASCKNWMMLREDYPNLRRITMHFPPLRDAASYVLKTAEVLSGLSHVQSKNPRNFHSRRKDASHVACHGAARFLVQLCVVARAGPSVCARLLGGGAQARHFLLKEQDAVKRKLQVSGRR